MKRLLLTAALSVACAGCVFNHGVRDSDVAIEAVPGGRRVSVEVRAVGSRPVTYDGELLEVRDSELVVLGREVVVIGFHAVSRIRVSGPMPRLEGAARTDYARGRPGDYLRVLSRFPWGAPAGAMRQILNERGQPEERRVTG